MALGTTGALIASAAIQAGTSAVGFAQAGKARKDMKQAEAEADAAIAEARKKLEVNYLAGYCNQVRLHYRRAWREKQEVRQRLPDRCLWRSKLRLHNKELVCLRKCKDYKS